MLEGRDNPTGWLVVAVAVVALVAFAGLLFVRGGSAPPISLTAGVPTARPSAGPSTAPLPSGSGLVAVASPRPSASRATAASASPSASAPAATPSGLVAGATSKPTPSPTRTPRPTVKPTPSATASATASALASGAAYRLPASPQRASVALENGHGGCPVETSFSFAAPGRLTANSPSNHKLTGKLSADGSFNLAGSNPVERWIGTLSGTGGTGSYFVVTNGCTEGYETTIAFHP